MTSRLETPQLEARLAEALEQQAATREILRVISRSPADPQPVFDTIVESAGRLCGAESAAVYRFEDGMAHFAAFYNFSPETIDVYQRWFPWPVLGTDHLRRVVDGSVLNMPDLMNDPHTSAGRSGELYRTRGVRSAVFVPMVRDGQAIGAIGVSHHDVGAFSDQRVQLLTTFAEQAAIAIENVRLFKALEARSGELGRSVEQLTALGEVSQAVSATLDVETVLDTIVSRAAQLGDAEACAIYQYDDATQTSHVRATHNFDAAFIELLRAEPFRRGEGALGRAIEAREPAQIADIRVPGAYRSQIRDQLIDAGFRAVLSVPMLREDQVVGGLSLVRKTPGEFSPGVIGLLRTFATQSVLAIQNARLFREIADKSREVEAASRHKSEFLAHMSHELRTPLNAIIGFSEVLTDRTFGELNEKQDEFLRDISASGRHLLSLINDILDLAKVEAGRMELTPTDFDLPNAIENALIVVREQASRRGVALGHTIEPGLGPIRADERKVKQVLLNLLSNALKFTGEGGRVHLGVGVRNEMVEISVADTGVGIAPEDQEAVFEEFRQVGPTARTVEGTGLGLAVARRFIELHGGRIWVRSQVGAGSTFTFTLPLPP